MTPTVADRWEEMLTVALLGTDRREPPPPAAGLLADLAADEPRDSPSQRLLQQAAATTVMRRAGILPAAAVAPFAAPPGDPRLLTPPAATATWRQLVVDWPVLEDEWLLAVVISGRRLAPELVGPLLARHRTDAVRRARVLVAAGPLAAWLVDHQPHLAASGRRAPDPEAIGELADLPTLPQLAARLHGSASAAADAVGAALGDRAALSAQRPVLVNFVARVDAISLPLVAERLDRFDPGSPAIGLAFALADLARLRHRMLTELEIR
ncbi:MAG: hypothetical protein QM733_10190 [Ilumatobacteraceae bacterium]